MSQAIVGGESVSMPQGTTVELLHTLRDLFGHLAQQAQEDRADLINHFYMRESNLTESRNNISLRLSQVAAQLDIEVTNSKSRDEQLRAAESKIFDMTFALQRFEGAAHLPTLAASSPVSSEESHDAQGPEAEAQPISLSDVAAKAK